MNFKSSNLKLIIGLAYLVLILIGLFFLFSAIDLKDLTSYEFIRKNKDLIIQYKDENFIFLTTIFFIFSVIWILMLGFASPLLLFSGFVFGKWWGTLIILIATTVGATLLYTLVGYFFRDLVEKKLVPKFYKLKEFFEKNDILYYTAYRFIGGGGLPYAIQNILPIIFNMPIKNYAIATLIGSVPSMFITVSLGSGIQEVIGKSEKFNFFDVIKSPEIYLPIVGFVIILIIAFVVKKIFFKKNF